MIKIIPMRFRLAAAALLASVAGCVSESAPPASLMRRTASVVVEGCALDPWQRATLDSSAARAVISEVILLCLSPRDGGVAPMDPDARAALRQQIGALRASGYRALLGLSAVHDAGPEYSPERFGALLADAQRRAQLTAALQERAQEADGLEIALPTLKNSSARDLSAWLGEVAAALRPARKLGLFAPPSSKDPSDLPGGDAVDLRAVAGLLDRVRLMTLDYSCCDGAPGPTTDAAWIGEVAALARGKLGATPFSFALPLYGVDFGPGAAAASQRQVSYAEAVGVAGHHRVQILRAGGGALSFSYDAADGRHDLFFEDARSITLTRAASDPLLPAEAGVLYYGLGGEDPALWPQLQSLQGQEK